MLTARPVITDNVAVVTMLSIRLTMVFPQARTPRQMTVVGRTQFSAVIRPTSVLI